MNPSAIILATLDDVAGAAGRLAERLAEIDVSGPVAAVIASAAAHLDGVDEALSAYYLATTGAALPGAPAAPPGLVVGARQREIDRLRAARVRTAGRLRFCRCKISRLLNARRVETKPPETVVFPHELFA